MAEKGRGYAISPLKVNFAKVYLLRVLTTLRVVQNVKKAIAWSSRAEPSFGFHQNSPVKNFRTAKIFFQLAPFLPTKIFPFSTKKSGKKVCALHARKRAQSVGRYQPMSLLTRFFANRAKKISPINDQKKCREQPTLFVIHSLRLSARTTSRNHLLRGDSGSEQFHVIASSVK